jgi:hypothetical protein
VSLLLPVAAIMLVLGSVLVLRAAWLSDAQPPQERRRAPRVRKVAYDKSLRRAA